MLLRGVLVQVYQGKHLVQVDVQQIPDLVDQHCVVYGVHGDMVSSIITDTTSFNVNFNVHTMSA